MTRFLGLPPELLWFAARARPFSGLYKIHLGAIFFGSLLMPLDPLILKWIIDDVLPWHREHMLWLATFAYFTTCIFRNLFEALAYVLDSYLGQRIALTIRVTLAKHVQELSEKYSSQASSGDVLYRLDQDVEWVEQLGGQIVASALRVLVSTVTALVIMLILNWKLTLVIVALVPPMLWIRHYGAARLREVFDEILAASGQRTSLLQQQIGAVTQIQLLGRRAHEARRLFQASRKVLESRMRRSWIDCRLRLSTDLLTLLASAAVLGFGGWQVLAGALTIGGLVAFMSYLHRLFNPLHTLVSMFSQVQRVRASLRRIIELNEEEPEVVDRPDAVPIRLTATPRIDFDKVGFDYEPGRQVLRGLSFTLQPGEKVALVGPSGSGKSTAAKLLARLHEVDSGRICVEGVDLRAYTRRSLRRAVTLVPQDPAFFEISIAENLRFARPDASLDVLRRAARTAQIENFVESLPAGWDEPIGPRGTRLSGGQRQRLAIARALLQEPEVLVLDEATAALDGPTERQLLDALRNDVPKTTLVLIAHRLSAILWADRILVLQEGRLVAAGSHQELLLSHPLYRRLCEEQAPEEALPAQLPESPEAATAGG